MCIPKGSLNFFCDESDVNVHYRMMLVGGFYIPKDDMMALDKAIIKIKKEHHLSETDAIKWSWTRKIIHSKEKIDMYKGTEKLKADMLSLINVKELKNIRLIMAICHKWTEERRDDAWKESFRWVLQRLCIILDRKKKELNEKPFYPFLDVICDWPPSESKRDEFFESYQNAYIRRDPMIRNSRSLREFKACPCLVYSSAYFSLALQLTDFFVGATKDFFHWCYGNKPKKYRRSVDNYFCKIYKAFHKDPEIGVVGCGLITPKNIKSTLIKKLKELSL